MDVVISHGRDDTVAVEPLSLIDTSNDGSEMESPIFRLPIELIILIFRQCKSGIRHRLTLTHTCRRWRHIAVNDASLWSHVQIQTRYRNLNSRLGYFLSLLGMQLDRTAIQLLDVEWFAEFGDDLFIRTLQIIREKAPFSRWRTLRVYITGGWDEDAPWSSVDAFTNLETLQVYYGTSGALISVIDRTVTSRLKILDLWKWPTSRLETSMTSFAKSFTHISTFISGMVTPTVSTSIRRNNIVHLQLTQGEDHPFPFIQTYEVETCIFTRKKSTDLGNLTILTVTGLLMIEWNCQVFLPALRELKLETLLMRINTKFEAPALDALHFANINYPEGDIDPLLLSNTNRSLLNEGYLLSPNTSIVADSHLLIPILITLLTRSPKVTHAHLRFDNWGRAQTVLSRLFRFTAETDSPSTDSEILCPRLSELRLDFDWRFSEPSASEEWLLAALRGRREPGSMTPLSIYAGWKGEGTYVLLRVVEASCLATSTRFMTPCVSQC